MSNDKFLQQKLTEELGKRTIESKEIDNEIIENLNPKFALRDYQKKAFQLFKVYYENNFDFKENPLAVLFNMATGSGKTLIMAGLILYLYKKGYNNFLFFVNSNNIIEKTKDNFLSIMSDKYLFKENININGININISEVKNYQGVNSEDINICFTTIQKLHNDLTNEKENSITFDDFQKNKLVLIADEAHHGQGKTKNKSLIDKTTWENTIENIFQENGDNILLEFTATMGYENDAEIYKKYLNRLLYKYDLKKFVKDKYSKNIEIFKVDGDKTYRMLSAVLINQYRQDLAIKHGISDFKPVILFKSVREIKESTENHEIFRKLIDHLEKNQINEIKDRSNNPLIEKIFNFYDKENLSIDNLIRKIKINFSEERCLNVNEKDLDTKSAQENHKEKKELSTQQITLNSLENKNNPIRVIFAVKKLDEGWDVLNLFDIVRPSDKKVSKATRGSTVSEAQLIGRGARYYPFKLDESQDMYKRKYDLDVNNDLRILEELYFHSFDESQYISELKDALIEEGLMDNNIQQKKLILKESFKKTDLYKNGKIFINSRVKKRNHGLTSFQSLKYYNQPVKYNISSGKSKLIDVFEDNNDSQNSNFRNKTIKISDIESHVIKNSMYKIDFFNFNNLKKYYPNLKSSNAIIKEDNFLRNMEIVFKGTDDDLNKINNKQLFRAVYTLLKDIEDEILKSTFDYSGTKFSEKFINEIFHNKTLNINKNDKRADGCEKFLKNKEWYAFNANYGTNQEKACVEFVERIMDDLNKNYEEIYILRNELFFKIYHPKNGDAFAPDFVMFLKNISNEMDYYQLFIEPKGEHIEAKDKWKENFLKEIYYNKHITIFDESKYNYKIIGLPFFNTKDENSFKKEMFSKLSM